MQQDNVFSLLGTRLSKVLSKYGYREPTPVQSAAIPLILSGYSVLIASPTGSGKTEAALFPVMSMILRNRLSGIRALYITPLKSLNRDIFQRMASIAEEVGLSLRVRHGDSRASEKKEFLRNPPAIAIMTPETFYLLLSSESFRRSLRYLEYVIVDEVHELLSSKRGVELSLAIERVDALYSKKHLKIIALSATLSNPFDVARLIMGHRLFRVIDASRLVKRYAIEVNAPCPKESCSDSLESLNARVNYIADKVVSSRGNVLLFTNTRDTAEVLGALLRSRLGNIVRVHHGSLSRDERLESETYFRDGKVRLLIATSSLELGIDIGRVDLVIQYLSPRQASKLVQRVGRASHKLGLVSRGIIVASPNVFDILESAVIAARAMRGNLEDLYIHMNALDALIHQVVGLVIERGSIKLLDAYNIVTRSKFYENLDIDQFIQAISVADSVGILRFNGNKIKLGPRSKSYYFSTTMITETKQYDVIDSVSGKKIGVLDEEFVATLDRGDVFVLAGRVWEVIDIATDIVRVIPRRDTERLIPPAWEGELIPVEYGVAREVGSILRRFKENNSVLEDYPLSEHAKALVARKLMNYLKDIGELPSDRSCIIEHYGDVFIIYSFLGSRGNKALEYLISAYIAEIEGFNPSTASTPYVVAVRLPSRRSASYVRQILQGLMMLSDKELIDLVKRAVKRSKTFEWALYRVSVRSGAIQHEVADTTLLKRTLRRLADTILGEEAFREILVRKIDVNALLQFINELRKGIRKLRIIELRNVSILAEDAVSEARFSDKIIAKQLPSTIIAEAIKRRLSRKEVYLVCLMCGSIRRALISNIEDTPKCEECGSRMLAPFTSIEEAKKIANIVRKRQQLRTLTKSEARLLREAYERANIVLNYGKKGVEALSWIGIGPSTARRVLKKLVFGEEAFYKALIEAEVQFHKYKHKLQRKE